MQTFLYLVLTLVLLSIMVVIHELGHFLVAKLFKVTILEFSVGMGPAIFTTKKKKKAEIVSRMCWLDLEMLATNRLLGSAFHSGPS